MKKKRTKRTRPGSKGIGIISTLAGGGQRAFKPTVKARQAVLTVTTSAVGDGKGNTYVVSQLTNRIWKVDKNGEATIFAGTGRPVSDGDGGPAIDAGLHGPTSVAVDGGYVYIVEQTGNRIRRVDGKGIITTVAGSGRKGSVRDGLPATKAALMLPNFIVVKDGELYFTEFGGNRVRQVSRDGTITTVAGTGQRASTGDGGPAAKASLNGPVGLAFDQKGRLYVSEIFSGRIRRIDPRGIILTVAGYGQPGEPGDGGSALDASLLGPAGLTVDADGNLYVAEWFGNCIRKIDTRNVINTFAGAGAKEAKAQSISLDSPYGVSVDEKGTLLVTQLNEGTVDSISRRRSITRVAGEPSSQLKVGDNGPAADAFLFGPADVTVDKSGTVYISDTMGNRVRSVGRDGIIQTFAGTGAAGISKDGQAAARARLTQPVGVIPNGKRVCIIESNNSRILEVDADGRVKTIAGTGKAGFGGDGGPATKALLNRPHYGAQFRGELYFADTGNNRVRKIDRRGVIRTVAGNGEAASTGDGGPATEAALNKPQAVAFDGAGNMYISELDGHRIRKVDRKGIINAFAGSGKQGFSGAGGPATKAKLNGPMGLAVDERDVYIADGFNNIIWQVDGKGVIAVAVGNGTASPYQDGIPAAKAGVACVVGVAVQDLVTQKNLLVAELDGGIRSVRLS